jgi:hypothetical protein
VQIVSADTWIYGILSADATLAALIGGVGSARVYRGMAPEGVTFPVVVYFYMPGGQDVRGVGTVNIMVNGFWVIKAIDRHRDPANAATIADRVHALLHGQASGSVLACVREEPVSYVEFLDGALYQHIGGAYRLIVQ